MSSRDRISIDIFKVIARSMSESSDLDIMANHMAQLLVAALGIKACTIFALNPETDELEILASVGLSLEYLDKGPIMADKSIVGTLKGKSIVVRDVAHSDRLQYPQEATREGIGAMVSVPILFSGAAIGVLRLYHHEVWDISDKDLDSLLIFSENIGLAMMYTRVLNALQTINETMNSLSTDLVPLFKQ